MMPGTVLRYRTEVTGGVHVPLRRDASDLLRKVLQNNIAFIALHQCLVNPAWESLLNDVRGREFMACSHLYMFQYGDGDRFVGQRSKLSFDQSSSEPSIDAVCPLFNLAAQQTACVREKWYSRSWGDKAFSWKHVSKIFCVGQAVEPSSARWLHEILYDRSSTHITFPT
jgi:hypothetical protein